MFKAEDYVVAIPSYKRADKLKKATLMTLKYNNVDPKRIHVFVADEEQKKVYEDILDEGTYGKIVVGIRGMMNIRNFITEYFPVGAYVFCIDDDISHYRELIFDKNENREDYQDFIDSYVPKSTECTIYVGDNYGYEKRITNLEEHIIEGFHQCEKAGTQLFGFYTSDNPLFMSKGVSTNLTYIIGSSWGMINPGDIYVTMDDKEDYERTIRFYERFGAVCRLNYVGPATNYYDEPGGMQEERTLQRVKESALKLADLFPMFCKAFIKRSAKGEKWELRLKDKRPKENQVNLF
jgi:hypothetical protein